MKVKNLQLKLSFLLLLIFELSTRIFYLDGLSIFKIVITVLVWCSFGIALFQYVKKHKILHKNIPAFTVVVLILLLGWNILGVLRSILTRDGSMITIIGNVFTSLSLLVPFVIIFSISNRSIKMMNDLFVRLMLVGIPLFLVFYILSGGSATQTQLQISFLLLQPIVFLILLLPFQNKKIVLLVLLAVILLFYISSKTSIRTMMIREILHFLALFAVYLVQRFRVKIILVLALFSIITPFVLLQQGIVTGESPFEKYLSKSSDDEYSVDTRTFLYKEVYIDLIDTNRMLIGKGANGRYYSDYFSTVEGDSPIRLNIEVGVLGILLKGGIIALLLNLILFISAIYLAFFRSNNTLVISLGFILLVHTVLLFVENVISYSTYNFTIWFFVGICFSNKFRRLTDDQIKKILNNKV
ncbi:hypothetical protein [Maribacter algarum]|uniref:hypothetical protein n=1 Tax=Maribacter algarum (ex Zhang et al. 2020) TaxID=2578118 RepID=UPI0014863B0F|nr:hypothetical protein [Maribacter algarum]